MKKPIKLTDEMRAEIRGSWAEIDHEQMKIIAAMTPAERAQRGFKMSEEAIQVAAYRLRLEYPEMSELESKRIVLARHYRNNPTTVLPLNHNFADE